VLYTAVPGKTAKGKEDQVTVYRWGSWSASASGFDSCRPPDRFI